ncbi:MAG: hypothetical protein LBQ66_07810, partial [Planctomycetaceae bacterium]|nr:hypothetical protein [Planctomycetaceae bacterium]
MPTLRSPNRFGVQFKLFWFYYTQRRAGFPRSSPPPLRGELMWYNKGGKPLLYHTSFLRIRTIRKIRNKRKVISKIFLTRNTRKYKMREI